MRSQAIAHLTYYFSQHGFVQAHPPLITSSDCEGAGEVFTVLQEGYGYEGHDLTEKENVGHFFKCPKYLTVSSQLHLEALALAAGKVWALSPTFRAEKSDTPRHLSEFYMLEAEIAFVDDLGTLMDQTEEMIKHLVLNLTQSKIGEELLSIRRSKTSSPSNSSEYSVTEYMLSKRWNGILHSNWPRIKFRDALQLLQNKANHGSVTFRTYPSVCDGFQQDHEKLIVQELGNGGPVFITDYPKVQKPFYMAANPQNEDDGLSTVACFDLLMPEICEVVGGSIREHRLSELLASMKEKGVQVPLNESEQNTASPSSAGSIHGSNNNEDDETLKWYLDLRRYGSVPHGGYGLGFDRLLAYLAGVANIREMVTFPRWYGRCDC